MSSHCNKGPSLPRAIIHDPLLRGIVLMWSLSSCDSTSLFSIYAALCSIAIRASALATHLKPILFLVPHTLLSLLLLPSFQITLLKIALTQRLPSQFLSYLFSPLSPVCLSTLDSHSSEDTSSSPSL